MAISRIDAVRVKPGRQNEHRELVARISDRLQSIGLKRLALKSVATGGEATGAVYSIYRTDNMASYGAELEVAQADAELQDLISQVYQLDGPAMALGTSLLVELQSDPTAGSFDYDVASVRSSRVKPGRLAEVLGLLDEAKSLAERYGGTVRSYSSIVGGDQTGTLFSVVGYPSHEALGIGLDATTEDPEARAFLENVFGPDGPLELLSIGIHTDITPA